MGVGRKKHHLVDRPALTKVIKVTPKMHTTGNRCSAIVRHKYLDTVVAALKLLGYTAFHSGIDMVDGIDEPRSYYKEGSCGLFVNYQKKWVLTETGLIALGIIQPFDKGE
jgi:hypothetical protein